MAYKFLLVSFFLLTASFARAQHDPPTMIYCAEKIENGQTLRYVFNATGKNIFNKPVDRAYSNTWSWIFVKDDKSKLITAFDYDGKPFGIGSIQETQSTYLNLNRVGIKKNNKWGFYDKAGKLKIAHQFDAISHFDAETGMALVKKGKDSYMIDSNGIKLDVVYDSKDYSFEDMDIAIGMGGDFYNPGFIKIKEGTKTGLADKSGKILVPAEYDRLFDLKEKFRLISVALDGKHGVVSFGGKIIIPIEYKSVYVLNDYF